MATAYIILVWNGVISSSEPNICRLLELTLSKRSSSWSFLSIFFLYGQTERRYASHLIKISDFFFLSFLSFFFFRYTLQCDEGGRNWILPFGTTFLPSLIEHTDSLQQYRHRYLGRDKRFRRPSSPVRHVLHISLDIKKCIDLDLPCRIFYYIFITRIAFHYPFFGWNIILKSFDRLISF